MGVACVWCGVVLSQRRRKDAKFCGVRCRQAHFRFGRTRGLVSSCLQIIRVGYADPPYPGHARLYEGRHDFAGEVDFRALVRSLVSRFPDGWALSTSAESLGAVLRLCPLTCRVAAWFRGERPCKSSRPLSSWEPVIYCGGRALPSSIDERRVDALVHFARSRRADPEWVIGAKPGAFCFWLFRLLGLQSGDDFVDLFPGSGRVGYAWKLYCDGADEADAGGDTAVV
jgi:hypothetical protein